LLAACLSIDRAPATPGISQTTDTVTYTFDDIPVVYFSIPELSTKSDLIIIGQATATKEIINTARIPDDPTKPDPECFSIGQIYEIRVDDHLKGSSAKIIYVPQHQGFLSTPSGPPTVEQIAEAQKAYAELDRYFPSQPMASLLAQIDQPFTPSEFQTPGPYPAPVPKIKSLCPGEAGGPYPTPPYP
jgi:hypothetical protein